MHEISNELVTFIVLTVVFFMLFGVALLVIVDHKAKLPDTFHADLFSISGYRRGHPVISFLTTIILGVIIISLILELLVALTERWGWFDEAEKSQLLVELSEQRFSEKMRHFHNEGEVDKVNLGYKPVCFSCHGDYPHSKQRMVRSLLNMHTQFIGCMTCHTDPRKVAEDTYRFHWLNYSGIEVDGQPFGVAIDPQSGFLQQTDDYYSKIVISAVQDGEERLLEIPETSDKAREYMAIRDSLSDHDREAIKKRFHTMVSPKGRFCSRCHAPEEESYIPFRKLGFSAQRTSDVTNVNLIGIVEKYRDFYLPNLFSSDLSLPNVDKLVGEKHQPTLSGEELSKPRAWWRRPAQSTADEKKQEAP